MSKLFRFLLPGFLLLGSTAMGQWITQQSNFPAGVLPHTFSAVNEQVVWVSGLDWSTRNDWFSRTLDGGQTWTTGRCILPDTAWITSICALSADTAWASVMTNSITANAGTYRTIDGGKTWENRSNGIDTITTFFEFIHFFNGQEGVAVLDPVLNNYPLIYTTSNAGESWKRVADADNIPLLYSEWLNIHTFSVGGDVIYVGSGMLTGGRVFKSTDHGKSWSVSKCDFQTPDNCMMWPGFKDAENGMIVALSPGARGVGAAVTHDGGASWQVTTPPPVSAHFVNSLPGTAGGYYAAAVNYWNKSLPIYQGSAFTLDSGDSWTKIDDVPRQAPVFVSPYTGWAADPASTAIFKWQIGPKPAIASYPLLPLKFSQTVVGGTSQLQTVTLTNYGQEPLVISGLQAGPNARIKNSSALPMTMNFLESVQIGIGFSPSAAGKISDSVIVVSNAANAPNFSIHYEGEGVTIAAAQPATLYGISANSLYTIDPVTAKATLIGKSPYSNLLGLTVEPASQRLVGSVAISTYSSYYGLDAATGTKGALLGTVAEGHIRILAFDGETLYGATPTGKFFRVDIPSAEARLLGTAAGVYYLGLSVQPGTGRIYASLQSTNGAIKDVIATVNPADGDTTYIGATGDGQLTTSLAFSTAGVLYGLKGTGTTVNTLVTIDPATGAATTVGSTGVSGLRAIAWAPGTTAVDKPTAHDAQPQEFSLLQNYPNPFNSKTVISFTLPRAEHVNITLFDILGREIAVLANGPYAPGMHKVTWEANSSASGIYFYRMTAGSFSQMRKLATLE